MVIATMQRDAVAADLLAYHARYPNAIRHGEDGYEEYMDRWDACLQWRARRMTFYNTIRR
eukprot:255641-Amphidinium_carterae.1